MQEPIVADRHGNLFNKEGFLREWISDKKAVKARFPHISSPITDLILLHFEPNKQYTKKKVEMPARGEPGPWICPLKPNIEVNGIHRFSFIEPCGHVFCDEVICMDLLEGLSIAKYRARDFVIPADALCPKCSCPVKHIIPLVPTREELVLLEEEFPSQSSEKDSSKKKKKKHHHDHNSEAQSGDQNTPQAPPSPTPLPSKDTPSTELLQTKTMHKPTPK